MRVIYMEFENKKEEYIYYTKRCLIAKEAKDEELYLFYLAKMKKLLQEIEKE